jgi:hypothetical protein
MTSSTSSFDAFATVDKLVSKPVLGSDGAASWQEFRIGTKELKRNSTAPQMQVKRADRLGTGLQSMADERSQEAKVRLDGGDAALGSGYTTFKRKNDAEEAGERKRRKQIEKKIRPEKKSYFSSSEGFTGWKFDYIYTTRDRGTGYYWDGTDSIKKLRGIGDFPEEPSGEESNLGEASNLEPATTHGGSKKKKRKEKRKAPAPIVHDQNNPLEQVANAIRKRNEALKAPPAGLTTPLPSGWEVAESSGKVYYFKRSTGERQWDSPTATLPDGWKSAKDATGKEYYYSSTGETRWDTPV